jgi:hypothetical protein
LAPISFPPDRKVEIIKLRAQLQRKIKRQIRELAVADLTRYADEIRAVYLYIRDTLSTPPKLQNTDGEPFLSHKIHFNTQSAQSTFDALALLAWGVTKDEPLEEAELNSDDSLRGIEFAWLKKGNKIPPTWESTVLCHLKIFGKALLVEVNSANRAAGADDQAGEATEGSTRRGHDQPLQLRIRRRCNYFSRFCIGRI